MLQDLAFGKLDNAFAHRVAQPQDVVVCVQKGGILLKREPDDTLVLPTWQQVQGWSDSWSHWYDAPLQYIFCMQERNYFLWMGESGDCPDSAFSYEQAQGLRQMQSKEICFAAMTAWHLYTWYASSRWCGRCGKETVHDEKERMMRCPSCGNMIFPRINPAVIIAVTDGERLLLSKYAGRAYTRYALLAGFTEIGETLEETVAREVMEEVGLKVKNIRYYKSQPWGIAGNILMGFYCDLDGDNQIRIDETELAMAQWFPRNEIPAKDDGISLTREMIRTFQEGKEPK